LSSLLAGSQKFIDVSLVIPAYNEEAFIDKTVAYLDQVLVETELNYELIIVDDGSQDSTLSKVTSCMANNDNVNVVSYPVNRGKGFALSKGFSSAKGDIVVFLDGDLDIIPSQINNYIQALKFGDLVVASKRHPQSVVDVPFMRRFLSYGFNVLVKLLTGLKIQDTQTGLKAVRRAALKPVFSVLTIPNFAFDVELLVVATLYGLKIVEMPVKLQLSNKLFCLSQVWKMFMDLFKISYRLRINKWYQYQLICARRRTTLAFGSWAMYP
jgi:glycosyltransferase involved in cell wall biosynthesis